MIKKKQEPDFVSYVEQAVIDRIFTLMFRHAGILPDALALQVRNIQSTENKENLRIEGDLKDDFGD